MRRSFVAALAVAAAVASISPATAARPRPPRGELEAFFDVGGHRLFVHCIGRGRPTVILDAAHANTSSTWAQVQPEIALFTRVCSYDRANLGKSDRGPVPRTSQTAVNELRIMLRKLRGAGVHGPYVLVGHSLGGLHAQLFARQDGGLAVAGVVLVDATPADFPEVLDRFNQPFPGPEQSPEGIDIRASGREVQAAPPFPDIPLIVLTRTIFPPDAPEELKQAWQERQERDSKLSPQGELIVVEGAGHFIHRDRPEVVIDSIKRVVRRVRGSDACAGRRNCRAA